MFLYFLRHAESLKSREDRHGGEGMPLTNQGRLDVEQFVDFLLGVENVNPTEMDFICSELIQVRETAEIVERLAGVRFSFSSEVRNIYLGELDGLSREDAMVLYPESARQLEEWRRGERSIGNVVIPDSETMPVFYDRVCKFVTRCVQADKDVLLVGTRSVGVAVANIIATGSEVLLEESYVRPRFDPCSLSKYVLVDGAREVEYQNRTDYLSVRPVYPDD